MSGRLSPPRPLPHRPGARPGFLGLQHPEGGARAGAMTGFAGAARSPGETDRLTPVRPAGAGDGGVSAHRSHQRAVKGGRAGQARGNQLNPRGAREKIDCTEVVHAAAELDYVCSHRTHVHLPEKWREELRSRRVNLGARHQRG